MAEAKMDLANAEREANGDEEEMSGDDSDGWETDEGEAGAAGSAAADEDLSIYKLDEYDNDDAEDGEMVHGAGMGNGLSGLAYYKSKLV